MLRRVAERLSRGRAYVRRLPQACGGCRMYISPECGLSYWLGLRAAHSLLRNAAETVKPGSIVWDIGANMGLFSFAAAGLAGPEGRVYAFEPDTVLVNLLRRSAQLNPRAAPVEVIPCAVSDSVSLRKFNIAMRSRASNFLEGCGATQTGGVRESQTVLTLPLDWLAERIPPPQVLKIDVEGSELGVFRGAVRLLETRRPALIFESEILGYTFYSSELPPSQRVPLPGITGNTLALPSWAGAARA
jgi:FkbM family methyltransferase